MSVGSSKGSSGRARPGPERIERGSRSSGSRDAAGSGEYNGLECVRERPRYRLARSLTGPSTTQTWVPRSTDRLRPLDSIFMLERRRSILDLDNATLLTQPLLLFSSALTQTRADMDTARLEHSGSEQQYLQIPMYMRGITRGSYGKSTILTHSSELLGTFSANDPPLDQAIICNSNPTIPRTGRYCLTFVNIIPQ